MQGDLTSLPVANAMLRYASGALKNMTVTLKNAQILSSGRASGAVRARARDADIEEFKYRRAAAVIVRAIQRLPAEVRLRRVMLHDEREKSHAAVSALGASAVAIRTAERLAARRKDEMARAQSSRTRASALVQTSLAGAGRLLASASPQCAPASDASSTSSVSTAYYSVASSAASGNKAGGGAVGGACAPGVSGVGPSTACFEV
jgi:hypothetical protein